MNKNKKRLIVYPMALAFFVTGLVGCGKKQPDSSSSSGIIGDSSSSSSSEKENIQITPVKESVTIKNTQINTFDYTALFTIQVNGDFVAVKNEMIDRSAVINKEGTYTVTCTYQDVVASIQVVVQDEVSVVITCKVDSLTLKLKEVVDYDFVSLFSITEKSRPVSVKESMIDHDIEEKEGTYTLTCTYKGVAKSITVIVEESYKIEILEAYPDLSVPESRIASLDYKDLFYLYVDGAAVEITDDMIDASKALSPEVGGTYEVTLSYQVEESFAEKTVSFRVVEDQAIVITSQNRIVYPDSKTIDLTELFTIEEGDRIVPVTKDMISGSVRYDQIGTYTITLNYQGIEKSCTVEVKKGVHISYASSSSVFVKEGTDQSVYNFANDFIVSVDGTRFSLNNSFIDTEAVDFSAEGEYTATIVIPYGEKNAVDEMVNLTEYSLTITYLVRKNNAVSSAKSDVVTIDCGTSYDFLSNVSCTYNGKNRPVTDKIEWADDPTRTYAEVVSSPVNTLVPGSYSVVVNTYPYGLDQEPIVVEYTLVVSSGIVIEEKNTTVFVGDSCYPKDFFTVSENGEPVEVENEMIEGKVDFFQAGNYSLTLTYKGESLEINVSVIDSDLIGTYSTPYSTIVSVSETSSSDDTDGGYDVSEDEEEPEVAQPLKDMIITKDGIVSIDGKAVSEWKAVDANHFTFNISSFEYEMYYENGIAVLIPLNDTHMSYTESNRPFVYFNDRVWEVERKLFVNSSINHVFACTTANYSLDLFQITNRIDQTSKWFGLRNTLVEKTSADFYYSLEYGEFVPPADFDLVVGNTYSIRFLGVDYTFLLNADEVGKTIRVEDQERAYAGMTFTGAVEGESATLSFNEYQTISLKIGEREIFNRIYSSYVSLTNGGVNYAENTIGIYDVDVGYSYRLKLNPDDLTFSVEEKTGLFGYFTTDEKEAGKSISFFFDGYGKGLAYGLTDSTYQSVSFVYEEKDGLIEIVFPSVRSNFAYKNGFTFRIDAFRNVLTVVESDLSSLIEVRYVNQHIVDGAYVSFDKNVVSMHEDVSESVAELLSYIHIVTKDGTVGEDEKASYLDLSYVDFDRPGFYSVAVKAYVGDQETLRYYGIHINEPLYADHPLVGDYVSVNGDGYAFEFNAFGNATLTKTASSGTVSYEGALIFTESGFTFDGKNPADQTIKVVGTLEGTGLVSLTVTGQENLTGYFTSDSVVSKVTGIGNHILRAFDNGEEVLYFHCASATGKGTRVELNVLNELTPFDSGAIVSAVDSGGNEVLYAKILNWNSTYSGLQLADSYKGTYTCDNADSLILDGFGTSEKKLGEAVIGAKTYAYYAFNKEIIALFDENLQSQGYAQIASDKRTYVLLNADYADVGLVGTYGQVTYNSISTSAYQFVVDAYGVGYYRTGGSSDDEEYEDYSEDGDTLASSSAATTYYGRIVEVKTVLNRTVYVFEGSTLSTTPVTITLTLTMLDSYLARGEIAGEGISEKIYLASHYGEKVRYIGNNREKYISTIQIDGKDIYLYYATSDSALSIATIEVLNDIAFGTKGSRFNLSVGTNVLIEDAMCTESVMSPMYGYVYANEYQGTYANASTGDLVLDGFASLDFDTEGTATYNNRARTYRIYCDNVIVLQMSATLEYYFALDFENGTYTRVNANYSGDLLGTFTKVSQDEKNPTITFDAYSLAMYTTAAGTIYHCVVTHNATTNEFSLHGDQVGDIYGAELNVSGKLIGDGVLRFVEETDGNIRSYYFVLNGYEAEVYTGQSKEAGVIYRVKDPEGNTSYYYAETASTTLDSPIVLVNEKDSPCSEATELGAVFSVQKDGEILLVARLEAYSSEGGYVLADLNERNTYTGKNGESLFTDGFSESASSRGKAWIAGEEYTYYYHPSLDKTIVLYDAAGNLAKYALYASDLSFSIEEPSLSADTFDMGTYKNTKSPAYAKGFITFDTFGYFSIENYLCHAVFEADLSAFTFTGRDGNSSISGTGTVLKSGLIFFQYSGSQSDCAYYSTSENILSGGSNGKNMIYQIETESGFDYLFSKSVLRNAPEDYIGYVDVTLETPDLPLGTIGSVFTVTLPDGTFLTRGRWTSTNNGNFNVGYETSDLYYGAYAHASGETIVLDGFGLAVKGDQSGTYDVSSVNGKDRLSVVFDGKESIYDLDRTAMTYGEPTYDLLKDQTYSCSAIATFMTANVSGRFTFDGAGGVTIYLDCSEDNYYARWGYDAKNGVKGTYVLEGTTLNLSFAGDSYHDVYAYVFELDDASNPTKMICQSSLFESYHTGYIASGKEFILK